MDLIYRIHFDTSNIEPIEQIKNNLENKVEIKKYGDKFSVIGELSQKDFDLVKVTVGNFNLTEKDIIMSIYSSYSTDEIYSADYVIVKKEKQRNSKIKYVFQINDQKESLTEDSYAQKYDPERKTIFDLRFGLHEPNEMVGYTIDKPLPDGLDVIVEQGIIAGDVCTPKVKELIERNGFSGIKFLPIWLSSNKKFNTPDYYLMKAINPVTITKLDQIRINTKYPSVDYIKLPIRQKTDLEDFNYLDTSGITEVKLLAPRGITATSFVSRRVMEKLKEIKGIVFTAPVLFS